MTNRLIAGWTVAALSCFAGADTLSAVLTVDDAFEAYISTNPASQGTFFLASPGTWLSNGSATVALTPGVVNYLQIKGRDLFGNPQMFLGQFTLNGTAFRFENQTGFLVTSPQHWIMTINGFGGTPESIRDIGPNGTSPWGFRSGISASARFIWTQAFSGGNRYFTARIVPVSGTPVIDGHVDLLDFQGLVAGRMVEVSVTDGTNSQTGSVPLDAGGNFNFTTSLPPGNYTVGMKASHWLRKSVAVSLTVAGPNQVTAALRNGDCDGDNEVGIGDYALLSAAYGSIPIDSNWLENADLNGDEVVDIGDYAILSANYGLSGD